MIGTWAKRLALILGGVIASVLLAELVLRLFAPQPTHGQLLSQWPAIYRPSDILPYELIPNRRSRIVDPFGEFATDVSINSLGYRGREFRARKGDRQRVLVLGDSFTFGWGVEDDESYPARLEGELRQRLGHERVDVINAGFASGFYPDAYYLYLKSKGVALDPDLVIIGFYIGNDIADFDIEARRMWRDEKDGLPTRLAFTHSHLEDWYLVRNKKSKRYRTPVLRDSHLYQALFNLFKPLPRLSAADTFNHLVFANRYEGRTRNHMLLVQHLFDTMHKLTQSKRIPMLVAILPAREQVHPPRSAEFKPEWYDLDKPNRLLRPFFDGTGILYEDLLKAFRSASKTHRYYFANDNHWNRDGHKLAARRLADRVMDLKVLR